VSRGGGIEAVLGVLWELVSFHLGWRRWRTRTSPLKWAIVVRLPRGAAARSQPPEIQIVAASTKVHHNKAVDRSRIACIDVNRSL